MITNSSLHYSIIKYIINHGYAPDGDDIANIFSVKKNEAEKALHDLAEYHGIVLHPNSSKIWAIHPFSLAPTSFYVESDRGSWWGNCAWCSLGIAALLDEDVTIHSRIAAEIKPIKVHIENGRVIENDLWVNFPIPMKKAWDNVIYTCSNMLLFENPDQVETWSRKHRISKGDIQPIDKVWEFSKKWYGNHLDPEWKKWTVEEAKQIFKEFELDHWIWDLENSKSRF